MPPKQPKLPYRTIELATNMFARETGFSGPQLHQLFAPHTDELGPYTMAGGGPSRWQLFQSGLNSLTIDDQRRFLLDLCSYQGPAKYSAPPEEDLARLRSQLLGDSSPAAVFVSSRFDELENWETVRRAWDAALGKITSDPEGAITAARTMLESVCKHICDERGVAYDDAAGDLSKLYKAAASAMEIAPDQHSEKIIKQILSGVYTVVGGLGALRNSLSDSHGRGKTSVRPAPRHAKLAVNTGFAVGWAPVSSPAPMR